MPEYIYGINQRSDEWDQLRIGSVGGSSINSILAKGEGKTRRTLLYQLASEILSGCKTNSYKSYDMKRGIEWENNARACYEFITGNPVEQIALVRADMPRVHVSPDGLVNENGGLELKVMCPHVYIELIDTKKISLSYIRQCQHFLWVTEREFIDFAAFCPEIEAQPLWIKRIFPDPKIIDVITEQLPIFLEELDKLVKKVSA